MTFAFSRQALSSLLDSTFKGEWKVLRGTLLDIPKLKAERACLEMALFIRYLDDNEQLSAYVTQNTTYNFGRLHFKGGRMEELSLREVANKIIHAKYFEWDFSSAVEPVLVCHTRDEERWVRAEVLTVHLASVCGNLTDAPAEPVVGAAVRHKMRAHNCHRSFWIGGFARWPQRAAAQLGR
jgi:hypothetical protein